MTRIQNERGSTISDAEVFAKYADAHHSRWSVLHQRRVRHTTFGEGIITGSYVNPAGAIMFLVSFDSDVTEERKFTRQGLCNERFFPFVDYPMDTPELVHERQRMQDAHTTELNRRIAEQERRSQEQRDIQEFAALKEKYAATAHRDPAPASFLYPILKRIDAGRLLDEEQRRWLKKHNLHATLAFYLEREYEISLNPWRLVQASGAWRDAHDAQKALALTDTLLVVANLADRKLHSAILTTRGGALRDCQQLNEAMRCASTAIEYDPNSHYPRNLLGALHFQRGEPEQGEVCFRMAEELGGLSPMQQEAEMRKALDRSGWEERQITARYLLKQDPTRYQWATRYLNPREK